MVFLAHSVVALLLAATAPAVHATRKCGSSGRSDKVAAAYFAGYHANRGFPVSSIPWDRFTDIKYAFAETNADGSLNISKSNPDQLPIFVSEAKKHNVKTLISMGGWTGSRHVSTNLATAAKRTAFVKTCLDFVQKYSLDGIDIDYEYPNKQGLGCNDISPNDTANYLSFLQELRTQAPNLTLTAAGSLFPWNDEQGTPSTNLRGFADVLDYIMIMAYDIYGPWAATAGPNAPLDSDCDPRSKMGSAKLGVKHWLEAGIPANKLVLGIAAYGRGFRVNDTSALDDSGALQMYPSFNSSDRFQGSSWDTDPPIDDCGNAQPPSGTYPFWSLITEAGFLDETGTPRKGIHYNYDVECSQTPAVWNSTNDIWVSYDNAQSVAAKGQYIKDAGLKGFAIWEAGGDYNNILADSIRKALGL